MVELRVSLCIVEDEYGFILYHWIKWEGSDVDHVVPVIEATQPLYPAFRSCSFDPVSIAP
ncbi:MAG: hypothetical protein OXH65_00380 [Paracoccaceae bacterium]|nr:hypothetical protein [Paracoccaceae bacterium]MDE2673547.1 hypothetical protein [Paracoccaceae bacterium]